MVKGEKRNYQEIAISQCAKTHRNGGKREKKRSLTTFMCKKTHGMEERLKNLMRCSKIVKTTLSLLLAVVLSISLFPAEKAQAQENVYFDWQWGFASDEKPIQVEKGQKFNIGHYARVTISDKTIWIGYVSQKKAAYASSKKSVATVDQKGVVTAKQKGTTKITIKFKGKELTQNIQVVPKGAFGSASKVTKLAKLAKEIDKKLPAKITESNGFTLSNLEFDFKECAKDGRTVNDKGFLTKKESYGYQATNKLAVPQAGSYQVLCNLFWLYGENHCVSRSYPYEKNTDVLKVKSVSATTSGLTVTLKKQVTATQLLAATYGYDRWNKGTRIAGKKKAYTEIYIDGSLLKGRAELVKGSNKVKITPYKWNKNYTKLVKTNLVKGKTYTLLGCDGEGEFWLNGKKVTVK